MHKIKDITDYLEDIAPRAYQESYDNSGLITGNEQDEVTGILITLDSTEAVIDEAISKNCNLVVAHHPIIFKGLKQINGKNYVERTIIKAIKNDIAIYAFHTNLDNILNGVNRKIANKLELQNLKILRPKTSTLSKLVTLCPKANSESVTQALHQAGAGHIGNYNQCSFKTEGVGSFHPNDLATPHIGQSGESETVSEDRIEVIVPTHLQHQVLAALNTSHPYEEVPYYLSEIINQNQEIGAGMIGELGTPMKSDQFLSFLKEKMQLKIIRHTSPTKEYIHKIALCGGSGSFLLSQAIRQQADIFITGDFKYHEFFDAENHLMIADIGHYESEVFTKELIFDFLSEKFTKFALNLSEINTNPISYF
jgi:dinuclear metal center YbgI/SA1388 family protein